ncbi:tetratricopeptide repeat protein [Agaribacter flavus]|uniref:Tetratricopeptide repeat protein n=1 Tax=Agaribacter flavus TaxID=1902781 RepID=A0ABV7FXN7_9ALTE
MSVVNKMLRDLEGRERSEAASTAYIPPKLQGTRLLVLVIVSMVTIAVLASTLTLMWQGEQEQSLQVPKTIIKTKPVSQPEDLFASASPPIVGESSFERDTTEKNSPAKLAESKEKSTTHQASTDEVHAVRQGEQNEFVSSSTKEVTHHHVDLAEKTQDEGLDAANTQPAPPKKDSYFEKVSSNGVNHQVAELRSTARFAVARGDTKKAVTTLYKVLSIDSSLVKVRKQLASLLYMQQREDEAFQLLFEGLEDVPEDSSMRLMLARIAYKQGDQKLTMEILKGQPKTSMAVSEFVGFRAALAERHGEYSLAFEDYQTLVLREPQNAKWWLGLAVSQDKLALPEQALSSYRQVRQMNQLPDQVHDFVEQRLQALTRES